LGLDQEYIIAPLFLLDEFYKDSRDTVSTKEAYLNAKNYLENQLNNLNENRGDFYYSDV